MHVSIHDVKKVKFEKVYKLGGSYACTLSVVSRDGKDEITLFANDTRQVGICDRQGQQRILRTGQAAAAAA